MTENLFHEFDRNLPSAKEVLSEIRRVISAGGRSSSNSAREYFSCGKLPELVEGYLVRKRISSHSKAGMLLGMSYGSVAKILQGHDISENMLFRLEKTFMRQAIIEDIGEANSERVIQAPLRTTDGMLTQQKIGQLCQTLAALLSEIKISNSIGQEGSAIGDLERAQLIAVLEAALIKLRAPVVNVKETAGLIGWLKNIGKRSSEKALEAQIKRGIGEAVNEGTDLIGDLVQNGSVDDIANFF